MDLLVNLLFFSAGARFIFFFVVFGLVVRGNRAIDKLMDWGILDEGMGYLLAAPDVLRVGGRPPELTSAESAAFQSMLCCSSEPRLCPLRV